GGFAYLHRSTDGTVHKIQKLQGAGSLADRQPEGDSGRDEWLGGRSPYGKLGYHTLIRHIDDLHGIHASQRDIELRTVLTEGESAGRFLERDLINLCQPYQIHDDNGRGALLLGADVSQVPVPTDSAIVRLGNG